MAATARPLTKGSYPLGKSSAPKKRTENRRTWAKGVHEAAETAKDVTVLVVFLSPIWLLLLQ